MDQIWFWLDYCCGKKHGQRKRRFLGLSWILDKMNRKFQVIKQICGHCNVKCTVVLLVTSFGNEHCNASFGTAFVYRKSDEDFSEHLGKYTCRCNSSLKCWNAGQARSHKLGNMTSKSIALRITFSIFNTAFLIFPLEYPYAALSSSPSTLAAMCMHAAWIIWYTWNHQYYASARLCTGILFGSCSNALWSDSISCQTCLHTVPALLSSSQRSFPKCRFCFDLPDPQRTCSEEAAHFRPAAVSASLRVPNSELTWIVAIKSWHGSSLTRQTLRLPFLIPYIIQKIHPKCLDGSNLWPFMYRAAWQAQRSLASDKKADSSRNQKYLNWQHYETVCTPAHRSNIEF